MSNRWFFSMLPCSLAIAACADVSSPVIPPFDRAIAPNPERAEAILALAQSGEPMRGSDEMISYLNAVVPGGVGGVFRSSDGFLTVYLTDLSQAVAALDQLVMTQQTRRGVPRFPRARIRAIQGEYDWDTLRRWLDTILDMSLPEAVHTYDIDESQNRIRLVASDRAAELSVRSLVQGAGIPPEAVVMEFGERPTSAALFSPDNLQDTDGPVRGGFAVWFDDGSAHCTLGYNTEFGSTVGFVVASHCTGEWADDSPADEASQGLQIEADDRKIGDEEDDPPFFGSSVHTGCPSSSAICRYTDTAMFEYVADSMSEHGIIAGAEEGGIDLEVPDWHIQDDDPHCPWVPWCTIMGDTLYKVGSRTGLSVGEVGKTCEVIGIDHFGVVRHFICSDRVDGSAPNFVGSGDSGSPVFEVLNGANVELYGTLFAANHSEPDSASQYWFSPIENVRGELGSFEVIADMGGPESRVPVVGGRIGER